jgi:hypothetical protein
MPHTPSIFRTRNTRSRKGAQRVTSCHGTEVHANAVLAAHCYACEGRGGRKHTHTYTHKVHVCAMTLHGTGECCPTMPTPHHSPQAHLSPSLLMGSRLRDHVLNKGAVLCVVPLQLRQVHSLGVQVSQTWCSATNTHKSVAYAHPSGECFRLGVADGANLAVRLWTTLHSCRSSTRAHRTTARCGSCLKHLHSK